MLGTLHQTKSKMYLAAQAKASKHLTKLPRGDTVQHVLNCVSLALYYCIN